jgi:hypothetical protein
MKRLVTPVVMLAVVLSLSNAMAQEQKRNDVAITELEVTMVLIPPDAARPDVITKTIELPVPAARGSGKSNEGSENADAASDNRQDGLETAEEARERGREFGQEMAEQARENREDAGRGNAPDEPPGGPPDELPTPSNQQ